MYLARHQAQRLTESVASHLAWMLRLRARMERLGATPDDRLYVAVCQCIESLHTLRVHSHYLACSPGTAGHAAE
jgi:hypothetical protein